MTEEMKTAMVAINKWLYHGWNYKMVEHTYDNGTGRTQTRTLPQFLVETKWTCHISHMIDKWEKIAEYGTPHAYMTAFYAELDMENRRRLIEWVMSNYDREYKIIQ